MVIQRSHKIFTRLNLTSSIFGLLIFNSNIAIAASTNNADPMNNWNLIIGFLVFAATIGSAVLNIAAIRHWNRNWGLVSVLPLFGLLFWIVLIVISRQLDENSHGLWLLEIFSWAMLNMIYMVTAMTAKRIFAKRDNIEPTKS